MPNLRLSGSLLIFCGIYFISWLYFRIRRKPSVVQLHGEQKLAVR